MAKAVLISIQPQWCELIASGKKTLEVRKNRPKLETPFKCYIYCTKAAKGWFWFDSPNIRRDGAVIGEFICDTFVIDKTFGHDVFFNAAACMKEIQCALYSCQSTIYGWHISDLLIYDKPCSLNEFRKPEFPTGLRYEDDAIKRPPQSWCYVEELKGGEG